MSDEEQAAEPRYHNFSDVPKFTSETAEDWIIFIEKLQFYFESSGIKDLKLKKAILFAHTGPILYKQARKLISLPETTATISYEEVVKLLQKHYSPTVNVWLSRKRFESRNQYQNESFKDFVSELKVLAEPCGFEDIEKELLQRVILGMKNLQLQEQIFAEPHEEVTWESVNRKALSAEAAKQDVANLYGASSSEVHRIYSASTVAHSTVQGKQNLASQAVRSKCNCCGASNHNQSNCWYKNAICRFCNVKGHIERACRMKAQSSGSAAHISAPAPQPSQVFRGGKKWYKKMGSSHDPNTVKEMVSSPTVQYSQTYDPASLFMNNIRSIIAPPPILVDCMVNGVPISFEVDCGSGHSIIGYDLYSEYFSSVKLADPQLEMKTWSHQNLKIAGVFEATVQRKSFTASLPLIVLKESGQSLLGRAWFHKLGIMVDILNKVPHPLPCPEILSTNLVSQLPSTPGQNLPPYLTEFQDVFAPGLGSYTGPPAHIHLQENAVPIFCKPRPVPFALRDRVAAQLDQMVQDNIIEPVKFSEWSTPTVNLVKKDGTIRVCGDYSGTINPACKRDVYPLPTVDEILSKLNGGKCFAKLDLSQAFLQIPVDSETTDKLTLTTHKGLFRVLRLCAGLEGVVVYIDDLLIQTAHEAEFIRRLRKVIQRMRSAGLRLKLEKCINVDNLDSLGFHISTSAIKPSKEKIETLLSAPSPTDSLLSAELVVNETKADPVLIVVKSKILHRRLITNDPTVQEHLKKPNPTTWKIELPNLSLMLHVTPNPVTGKSPAQLLMGRCPRTLMDRAHPGTTVPASVVKTQAGGSTLAEGQKVMHRKYSSGPQWLRGTVSKVCRARHYIATTNTCMLMKRHIDQLIKRKFTQSKSICYPARGHTALASVSRDSINMEEPPSTNQEDIVSDGVFEDSDSTLQSEARQQDLSEDGPITAHTPVAQPVLNARTPSPLHSPFQRPSTPPSPNHRRVSQRIKKVPTHLKDYVKT